MQENQSELSREAVIGASKGNQDEEYEVRIDLSLVHDDEVSFNT